MKHRYPALDNSDDGYLQGSLPGFVVVVDYHHLLPGTEFQAAFPQRQTDGWPQQGGLDVAVAVAIVPGLFVGVMNSGRCDPVDRLFEVVNHTGFIL